MNQDWLRTIVAVLGFVLSAAMAIWRMETTAKETVYQVKTATEVLANQVENLTRAINSVQTDAAARDVLLRSHESRISRLEAKLE